MEQNLLFAAALGAFGLFAGGFLRAAANRVLRKRPVSSPSPYGRCGHRLRLRDHAPVIGYAALRGRCRDCGSPISPAQPIGEAATALLFAWIGWHYGPFDFEWIAALLLVSVLIVITHTDLTAMLIPNAVVFPALAAAIALRAFQHPLPWWSYAAGAAVGFGLLYMLAVASKGGMGGGDIKLYLFIGALTGLPVTLLSLFAAGCLGTIYGIAAKAAGRNRDGEPMPFGPFIAIGTIPTFLYAEDWIDAYVLWWIG